MLFRVIAVEETPVVVLTDELPAVHCPDALKLTSCIFGALFDTAVAVTVIVVGCVIPRATELGKGPRTIVCPSVMTAGGEGALWRGVEPVVSGTSVVVIV